MSQNHSGQDWETVTWTKKPKADEGAADGKAKVKPSRLDTDDPPQPKAINHSLPAKIKALRVRLRLSQTELAKQLSIDSKLIGQWEQGKGRPTPQQHARLNRLLNKNRI
jgi:DNA-binding transcriptional regulator YiaG